MGLIYPGAVTAENLLKVIIARSDALQVRRHLCVIAP